ncbi:MAG: hypothetical protein C0404_04350 [Verrucomicrobia bacterium]|nr:hypothetical protein [Verrucomicrobiota bacterium]
MKDSAGTIHWKKSCLGIDLQSDGPVVVAGERSGGRVATKVVTQSDARASSAADGIPVVGCLTARDSVTRWIEAPFMNRGKAEKVFPTLLDVELPFPLEECSYLFLDTSAAENGKTRALAVVARNESIMNRIDEIGRLGLDPVALDHEGLALWTQSLKELPPETNRERSGMAVLLMCRDRWTLAAGKGMRYLNSHNVKPGDYGQVRRLLLAAFPRAAGMEASAGSAGDDASIHWRLAGSMASDKAAVSEFRSEMAGKTGCEVAVHAEPASFLARALVTRALEGGALRCNMRTGDLMHPSIAARSQGRMMMAGVLALLAGIILCCGSLYAMLTAGRAELASKDAFSAVVGRAGVQIGNAQGEQAISLVRNSVAARLDASRPFMNAFEPSLLEHLSAIAGVASGKGMNLDSIVISRGRIQLSGKTKNWNSCEDLVGYLQKNGYRVKLDRKESLADELVAFTISTGEGK